jgi:hypothetical protein
MKKSLYMAQLQILVEESMEMGVWWLDFKNSFIKI